MAVLLLLSSPASANIYTYDLRIGQEVSIDFDNIKIRVNKVLKDERCPSGITCYWAGYVTIQIAVTLKGKNPIIRSFSNIVNQKMRLQNTWNLTKYKIMLNPEGVFPPREYNQTLNMTQPIKPEDYLFTFTVEYEESDEIDVIDEW